MRIQGAFYIVPEEARPSPRVAVAGPFETLGAALWWMVDNLESKLTPAQAALWQLASARVTEFNSRFPDDKDTTFTPRGIAALPAHCVAVLGLILHGAAEQFVLASAGPVR